MKNSILFYWSGVVISCISAFLFIFKVLPLTINDKALLMSTTCIICMLGAILCLTAAIYEQNKEKAKEKP
ncbi:hypothetical protein HY768_05275 [candidate division TA06 bacterium]|uniref:Uncharacterized protein n=1 Tax=candidate division TA06 bacterium TaxID=2250710 RepID=A0A933MKD3_UNCT6|nr:hypothetical protein [candidate division TA06 bacterium]